MSLLKLSNVSKKYGDFTAVEHVDLQIEKGEFLSLLGPSGCGKTTTLQMIAGFVEPTGGSIYLNGKDLAGVPPEKRGFGIVFQSYALFPHMTVADNVGFGLEMKGRTPKEVKQRVAEVLDMMQLNAFGSRYPKQLSGGQRQRVALARALAIEPEILLLDEPMSNLDAKLKEDMNMELRALQKRLNITTILITHDQAEAMAMSDRVAVMQAGTVVQLDTPSEAYENPKTQFVSRFLGRTNVFSGLVSTAADGKFYIVVNGKRIALPRGEYRAEEVDVFLRPERVELAPIGRGNVVGKVDARLFHGSHWVLEVATELGHMIVAVPNRSSSPPREGSSVDLAWSAEDLRVLAKT